MKIGVMNHPAKDVIKEIEWIGDNGFDFVDLTYEPPYNSLYDSKKIKETLEKYNLDAVGHTNPSLPAIYPIESIRKACLDEFKKTAEFFNELNIKKMTIHPFYLAPHFDIEEKIEANITLLREISLYCQKLKMKLLLENYLYPFDSPSYFIRVLDKLPDIKVHLDIGHCNIKQPDTEKIIQEFFEIFGSKIEHIHIHDNNGKTDEHLPVGCGSIDWKEIIRLLKRFSYNKTITLEVFCSDYQYVLYAKEKLLNLWSFNDR